MATLVPVQPDALVERPPSTCRPVEESSREGPCTREEEKRYLAGQGSGVTLHARLLPTRDLFDATRLPQIRVPARPNVPADIAGARELNTAHTLI